MLTLIESYLVSAAQPFCSASVVRAGPPPSQKATSVTSSASELGCFSSISCSALAFRSRHNGRLRSTAACNPVATALPWYSTYGVPPKAIMTTVCSNAIPVRTMLDLTALSIVFLIVTLAVPYTAASIVSGTVGLALSHAFEAAYVAQTIVRPITSALQTGFNKVAQIGNGSGDTNGAATGWVKSTDFGRQTQQLSNLGSGGGQRVPAPKDVRGTSVMPSRAPNTTPINTNAAGTKNRTGAPSVSNLTRTI